MPNIYYFKGFALKERYSHCWRFMPEIHVNASFTRLFLAGEAIDFSKRY